MSAPLFVRLVFWPWLLAALLAGHFQLLGRLAPSAPLGVLVVLTALLLSGYTRVTAVRTWVDGLDVRVLVALHLTRFAGFYLLWLYQHGQLPAAFAVRGGVGDLIVAAGALGLVTLPLGAGTRRHAITIWNVVGTVSLLLAVATIGRLGLQGDLQMRLLTVLPLSLLPTFLLPLLFASHVILFLRLKRAA